MKCEFCNGETVKKRVRKHHWLKEKLYIVENVEAEVCKECGEKYFNAKILDEIDMYLEKKHEVKKHLEVEVVNM